MQTTVWRSKSLRVDYSISNINILLICQLLSVINCFFSTMCITGSNCKMLAIPAHIREGSRETVTVYTEIKDHVLHYQVLGHTSDKIPTLVLPVTDKSNGIIKLECVFCLCECNCSEHANILEDTITCYLLNYNLLLTYSLRCGKWSDL